MCVCVFAKTAIFVHTCTHTHVRVDRRGCRHTVVREAAFSLSPGSVFEAASLSKKFELFFLNFSAQSLSQIVKIC